MIISFAWTTPQFKAGIKTVTRRDWSDRYFERWVRAWENGWHVHQGWSRSPRVKGAEFVANFRLTCCPYREALRDMPESDLQAEGGLWGSKDQFIELCGGDPDHVVTVVRFKLEHSLDRRTP